MMLLCLFLLSVLPIAEQVSTLVPCNDQKIKYGAEDLKIYCGPGCAASDQSVWGSGPYTEDSSMCRSCIHKGVITNSGGFARVKTLPPQDIYEGSDSNGITSVDYTTSFAAMECESSEFDTIGVDCAATAEQIGLNNYTISCGAGCAENSHGVWGKTIYTGDSSMCRSAIHGSGLAKEGGEVNIVRTLALESYEGTEQNGVTTVPYGNYPAAFICYKEKICDVAAKPAPCSCSPAEPVAPVIEPAPRPPKKGCNKCKLFPWLY